MADAGRVIVGLAKGVRLMSPGVGTRALSDRVKESLFAALEAEDVVGPGRHFLDLFAGSGAAGIEALSRASSAAVLVESDAGAAKVIADNLARAGLEGGTVVRDDVIQFLQAGRSWIGTWLFDAALIDPPYGSALLPEALAILGDPNSLWLSHRAIVVAKHFWRHAPPPQIGRLERYRERRFGETMLTFYRIANS